MTKIMSNRKTVGLISDTHGQLSQAAVEALQGVDLILHAGDVGDNKVLAALGSIAPVEAVRGNMDYGLWAEQLPPATMINIKQSYFFLIHDKDKIDLDLSTIGVRAVIFGHTHSSSIEKIDTIWYINPGSATHPRYGQNPSVGLITVYEKQMDARIIEI